MLVTKEWFDAQFTYDDAKYNHTEDNQGFLYLKDIITGTTIFKGKYPSLIKQINKNEFIINDRETTNRSCLFKHLLYNEEKQNIEVIFKHKYEGKNYLGTINILDDIYIMESLLETALYNANTKKELTLRNTTITLENDEEGKIDLIATIKIKKDSEEDVLTAIIDKDTLEFDGFYSRLQQRYIPLIQENNDFKLNYVQTVNQEVLYYLYRIEQQEQYYNQESDRKARLALRKIKRNK